MIIGLKQTTLHQPSVIGQLRSGMCGKNWIAHVFWSPVLWRIKFTNVSPLGLCRVLRQSWLLGGCDITVGNSVCVCVCVCVCVYVSQFCLTLLWSYRLYVTCQAPLSRGFSRQEYWSGLAFSSLGNLPNPGIKPWSPTLAGRFFTIWATGMSGNNAVMG